MTLNAVAGFEWKANGPEELQSMCKGKDTRLERYHLGNSSLQLKSLPGFELDGASKARARSSTLVQAQTSMKIQVQVI